MRATQKQYEQLKALIDTLKFGSEDQKRDALNCLDILIDFIEVD